MRKIDKNRVIPGCMALNANLNTNNLKELS